MTEHVPAVTSNAGGAAPFFPTQPIEHLSSEAGRRRDTIRDVDPQTNRALTFLVPLLAGVYVPIVGQLYIAETFLLLLLPVTLSFAIRSRSVRLALLLLTAWLCAQILTDLWRGTAGIEGLRAAANIFATMVDLVGFVYLLRGPRQVRQAGVALAAGLLLGGIIQPTAFTSFDPWKFVYATPLTIWAAAALGRPYSRGSTYIPAAGFAGLAVVHFAMHYRSLGAFCALSAGILLLRQGRLSATRRIWASLCILTAAAVLPQAYGWVAQHGYLGAEAQSIHVAQASGSWGLLFGARKETLFAAHSIAESPILGRGATPPLTQEDRSDIGSRISELGYVLTPYDRLKILGSATLPAHSSLLDSWVEAGVFGGIPWLAVILLVGRWFFASKSVPELSAHPLMVFLAAHLLWAALFSPYGGTERVVTTFTVAALLGHEAHRFRPEPVAPRLIRARPTPTRG